MGRVKGALEGLGVPLDVTIRAGVPAKGAEHASKGSAARLYNQAPSMPRHKGSGFRA